MDIVGGGLWPGLVWSLAYGDEDGHSIPITWQAAQASDTMRALMDTADPTQVVKTPFPVPSFEPLAAYHKAVEYLELAKDHLPFRLKRPLMDKGDIGAAGAPEWALNFINGIINSSGETDWPMIFHVLKVAHHLMIEQLLSLAAAKIASRICKWDKHQMAALFPHPALTPEQEMHLRQQEAWAEMEPDIEAELFAEEERERNKAAAAAALVASGRPSGSGSTAAAGAGGAAEQ